MAIDINLENVAPKNTADNHYANQSNPHSVTKSQVGLGNADNTSDIDKPVSTAAQTALNLKEDLSNKQTDLTPSATKYPTVNAVNAGLDLKQNKLNGLNIYKEACLLGDSITRQHQTTASHMITGSQGHWNWANWLLGSPFDFSQNLGVSGDLCANIFARIPQIEADIEAVFILAGTNDVLTFSSSATAPQIAAEIDRLVGVSGEFPTALQKLKNMGKYICISTIPPNNAFTPSTDTRIQVLDAVNAWILSNTISDSVCDLFAATWNSALPTTRVFKANYSNDGTHFTNLAGLNGGIASKDCLEDIYNLVYSPSHKYKRMFNPISQIGAMRTIAGLGSTISIGSGTLASGWRSVNNGSGTPTVVLTNADNYTAGVDYIAPNSQIIGNNEKWQKVTITGAVSGSNIRFQLATALVEAAIRAGDNFFISVDVMVESHTNLNSIQAQAVFNFVGGTTPVDQPYGDFTTTCITRTNAPSAGATEQAYDVAAFRATIVSEPQRAPENINETSANTTQFNLDFGFNGAGGAVVYFGRPQLFRRSY